MKNEELRMKNDAESRAVNLKSGSRLHSQFSILRSSFFIRSSLVPLWFVLFCTGCGSTGDVSGVVTLNGTPVTSGNVMMMGSDGLPHHGKIQRDGSYTVLDVPIGAAMVAVVSPDPQIIRMHMAGAPPEVQETLPDPNGWFPIPKQYCDAYLSGLRCEVNSGENNFDLPLVGHQRQARRSGRR